MKHAILLLSSYGVDYLNNFLDQFNNDKRYDIFIHIDGKSKLNFDNHREIITSNIKYIGHIYESKRYSLEMVYVMYELLFIAYNTSKYDYFHFFSESCYFVKSLDEFYNFFINNNFKSYIRYSKINKVLYKNVSETFIWGSQWMSLHNNIVKKLIDNKDIYNYFKNKNGNIKIPLIYHCPDESVLHKIIVNYICKGNAEKCNITNKNLRYIRFSGKSHPDELNLDNVVKKEINFIVLNCFIIRKINYKDLKALKLIKAIKDFYNTYHKRIKYL